MHKKEKYETFWVNFCLKLPISFVYTGIHVFILIIWIISWNYETFWFNNCLWWPTKRLSRQVVPLDQNVDLNWLWYPKRPVVNIYLLMKYQINAENKPIWSQDQSLIFISPAIFLVSCDLYSRHYCSDWEGTISRSDFNYVHSC